MLLLLLCYEYILLYEYTLETLICVLEAQVFYWRALLSQPSFLFIFLNCSWFLPIFAIVFLDCIAKGSYQLIH